MNPSHDEAGARKITEEKKKQKRKNRYRKGEYNAEMRYESLTKLRTYSESAAVER